MKNVNKTRMLIILIYLLHLLVYLGALYVSSLNIANWNRAFYKLKMYSNIIQFNHIYVSLFYYILTTSFFFKSLNLYKNKLITILAYISSFAFAIIAIYMYRSSKDALGIFMIANGITLSLNAFYKKINLSN